MKTIQPNKYYVNPLSGNIVKALDDGGTSNKFKGLVVSGTSFMMKSVRQLKKSPYRDCFLEGQIFKSKISSTIVKSTGIIFGTKSQFEAIILSNDKNNNIGNSFMFNMSEFEFREMQPEPEVTEEKPELPKSETLFEVVTRLQNQGYNVDFDKDRVGNNICYVGMSGKRCLNHFRYGKDIEEWKLVELINKMVGNVTAIEYNF